MEFKEDIREWVSHQREISRVQGEMAPLEKKIKKLKDKSASLEAKIITGEHLSREATLYWRDGVHQTSAMKVFQKATVDIARKLFIKKS